MMIHFFNWTSDELSALVDAFLFRVHVIPLDFFTRLKYNNVKLHNEQQILLILQDFTKY